MDGISEHGDVALAPALQQRRPAVVEISLLDDLLGGVVQTGVDLLRPAVELLPQVLQVRGSELGVRRQGQEGVPLDSAAAHIRGDEVLARADVHLLVGIHVREAVEGHHIMMWCGVG